MMNLKTQGFVLLDVDVVALNNAGKNNKSNFDNAVATKKITKNGKNYVYVSGQAWRYWWRESLQKNMGWEMSPIIRDNKIAYTEANPIKYADDDVFGYMRAAAEKVTDDKGKTKSTNITVTRISPLKNSAIISVASVIPAENWSSMSRQEGDAVPYSKQEYSAVMKGMFSLDLNMVGAFSNYNKTGYVNLSEQLKKEAMENGCKEIEDSYVKTSDGNPAKLICLSKDVRLKRIKDSISALKYISGGAMQTNNMGDVTPKFIILATTKTGNHPFSNAIKTTGAFDEQYELNVNGILETINDYKETFVGKIYIGTRNGFFDEELQRLKTLIEENLDFVEFYPVNEAIDKYCEQLKTQVE
jgi:CRISPR-associated protein Cas7/Cst2/DevR, subtype I-B/TNEAP